MTTSVLSTGGVTEHPSRPRAGAAFGRRAVLGAALSLGVGAILRPPEAVAATASAAGATIHSYGHSYTVAPDPYVTMPGYDEYQLQLGRSLASGPVISHGRSSSCLLDTIGAIIAPTFMGSTASRWRIGDKGIVLLHDMMNDVSRTVGGDPDYLNAYQKALHLALGVFGAGSFRHADTASRIGGGWAVSRLSRVENGRTWSTKKPGSTISFRVPAGDSAHVSSICTDPRILTQGTLRAECNGRILGYFGRGPDSGSYYACNRAKTYTDSVDRVSQNKWSPAGWRITHLNAAAGTSGAKTLTLRKVDNTAAAVWVQGVYAASTAPPWVLVAKEPPRNPAAIGAAYITRYYANEPRYRALIDSVCRGYRGVRSVDLWPGWDNTTMVSVLDTGSRFHPNTLGMTCIAANFELAFKALIRRP